MAWKTACARCRELRDDIEHVGIYSYQDVEARRIGLVLEYTCPCAPDELLYTEASLYYAHFLMRAFGLRIRPWPDGENPPLSEERIRGTIEAAEETLQERPTGGVLREWLRRWLS